VGIIQEQILALLEEVGACSTHQIAKRIRRRYNTVYYALLSMKDKGIVDYVEKEWRFPNSLATLKAKMWYLKKYEDEVLRCLK